jgi:hypothetical protein
MLTEGWDANNVTQVLGRRSGAQPVNAFDFANGFIGGAVTRASINNPGW